MSNDFLLSAPCYSLANEEEGKVSRMNFTHEQHTVEMMMSYGSLQKSINYQVRKLLKAAISVW
jgi:hypothetical protein